MGLIYEIQRDNKKIEELLDWLEDNKPEIKDFIFGVRFTNGNLYLHCDDVPLEMMCTISKMLDLRIDETIQGPDEDEDDELEEDEGE